jgi:CheY-like chemotaxis protein
MPEMNGHEVATEIKRLKPQIPIVMVSSDDAIPEPALNVWMLSFLRTKHPAACCR